MNKKLLIGIIICCVIIIIGVVIAKNVALKETDATVSTEEKNIVKNVEKDVNVLNAENTEVTEKTSDTKNEVENANNTTSEQATQNASNTASKQENKTVSNTTAEQKTSDVSNTTSEQGTQTSDENEDYVIGAFEKYLKEDEDIEEYKIESVKILTREEVLEMGSDALEFEDSIPAIVTYSVKPVAGKYEKYLAGNGTESGEWVINKTACIEVANTTKGYSVMNIGTSF